MTEPPVPFTEVVVPATANGHDLERLCRPLLGALAEFARLDPAYLMVIDWVRRTQTVRFVHNGGAIEVPEGLELDSPPGLSPQALLGVTVSPDVPETHPDSQVAKHLEPGTYVSVPIVTADHQLFGDIRAARRSRRRQAPESCALPRRGRTPSEGAARSGRTACQHGGAGPSDRQAARGSARRVQARCLYPERLQLGELLRATAQGFDVLSDAHQVRFDGGVGVPAGATCSRRSSGTNATRPRTLPEPASSRTSSETWWRRWVARCAPA